jgi:hypothetical protein
VQRYRSRKRAHRYQINSVQCISKSTNSGRQISGILMLPTRQTTSKPNTSTSPPLLTTHSSASKTKQRKHATSDFIHRHPHRHHRTTQSSSNIQRLITIPPVLRPLAVRIQHLTQRAYAITLLPKQRFVKRAGLAFSPRLLWLRRGWASRTPVADPGWVFAVRANRGSLGRRRDSEAKS